MAGSVLETLTSNIGEAIDIAFLIDEVNFFEAVEIATNDLSQELSDGLSEAAVGAFSAFLVSELADIFNIGGVAEEIFTVGANTVVTTVILNSLDETATGLFEGLEANFSQALGSYVGSTLANELVGPDNELQAILGAGGGAIGGILAAKAIENGLTIATSGFVNALAITSVYAFVGTLLFTAIGKLFGSPRAGADVAFDPDSGLYQVEGLYSKNGGNKDAAQGVAGGISESLNAVLSAIGGDVINPSEITTIEYGLRKSKWFYQLPGQDRVKFGDIEDVINFGVLTTLKQPKIAGGDVYVKRSVYSSVADDVETLMGDVIIAQDYSFYTENKEIVDELIAGAADSAFAATWLITLQRARELGLHRRHESDNYGGFDYQLDQYDALAGSAVFGLDAQGERLITLTDTDGVTHFIDDVIARGSKDAIAFTNQSALDTALADVDVAAVITGTSGNDVINGGDLGNDILGGAGDDTLTGGANADWLFGEAGNDTLNAGGADGNYLSGGANNDTLNGAEGSDWLDGGDGIDQLYGGAGDDILDGGAGDGANDTLRGGAGDDTFLFGAGDNASSGSEMVQDNESSTSQPALYGITNNLSHIDWSGTSFIENGYAEGGRDVLELRPGVTVDKISIERDVNDLVITLLDAGDNPTNDKITLKDWTNPLNRIEVLRFADGEEIDIGLMTTFQFGTNGADILTGTFGNDFIHGAGGDDKIYGLAGNDVLIGGTGDDYVSGGDDDDWVLGARDDDYVSGDAGTDNVSGGEGNDVVRGGSGNDIVSGGRGNDTIITGIGSDTIRYGRGDGRDLVYDEFNNLTADDQLWTAVDTGSAVLNFLNADKFTFYNQYDVPVDGYYSIGTEFSRIVRQSTGEDVYNQTDGWTGNVVVQEISEGNLRVYIEDPSAPNMTSDAGEDTLEFSLGIAINDIRFQQSGDNLVIGIEDSTNPNEGFWQLDDRITISEWYGSAARSIETFRFANTGNFDAAGHTLKGGTDASETVSGTPGQDWLTGGLGDDFLVGGDGDDILNGNVGNDILQGGDGADTLLGGVGFDTADFSDLDVGLLVRLSDGTSKALAQASVDPDQLISIEGVIGTSSADVIIGNSKSNELSGDDGNDRLDGGQGDDTYLFDRGDGADILGEGGEFSDLQIAFDSGLAFSGFTSRTRSFTNGSPPNISITFYHEIFRDSDGLLVYQRTGHSTGGGSTYVHPDYTLLNETTDLYWASIDSTMRLEGGETFYGNTLAGGDDSLLFGSGIALDDLTATLTSGDLKIVVAGQAGDQVTIDNWSTDSKSIELIGLGDGTALSMENDAGAAINIRSIGSDGTSGNDWVQGTSSANTSLEGFAGDDIIAGKAGDDIIFGGAGDDLISGGSGGDIIHGGDGVDTVTYYGSTGGVIVTLDGSTSTGGHASGDEVQDDVENVIGSTSGDIITGNASDNALQGGEGNDTLSGLAGADVLEGGIGDDTLSGGTGDDTLLGGDDADILDGDGGADTLDGGAGGDILRGGTEDDVLFGGDGSDTLLDGGAGDDFIDGGAGGDDLVGGDGADTLFGGAGNDTNEGGTGDDVYLYDRSSGNDTIDNSTADGADLDTILFADGITAQELWFERPSGTDNLKISLVGGGTFVTVTGWFAGPANQVERIQTADLQIEPDRIDALMLVMTGSAPPSIDQATQDAIAEQWWTIENSAPVVGDDAVSTEAGTPVTIAVLENDGDADGDQLTLTVTQDPSRGSLTQNPDGTITYTPDENFDATGDSFTYALDDGNGGVTSGTVTIDFDPGPNSAPTAVTFDGGSTVAVVDENDAGAVLGTLDAVDPNADDTHTFTADDTRFEIVGEELKLKSGESLDFETDPNITVNVTATDEGGLTTTQALTINVTDVNEAPTALSFSGGGTSAMIDENAGVQVGMLVVDDIDAADTHTFAVDDVRFEVVDKVLKLKAGQSIDFETEPSVTLSVTATDSGGLSTQQSFSIDVTATNEAPTAVTFVAGGGTTATVAENADGATIGTLAVADMDVGDTHTFAVDDARFEIVGSDLKLKAGESLDFESEPSITVNVTATDSGGLERVEALTIDVTDVSDSGNVAPTASDRLASAIEDTPLVLSANDFGFVDANAGDTLQSVRIMSLPAAGTLSLNGIAVTVDQVVSAADLAAGNLTFTPAADENGPAYAGFEFRVSDGFNFSANAATLTIDVAAVNDAPTVTNTSVTATEDTAYTFAVTDFAFADAEGEVLQAVRISSLPGAGALTLGGASVVTGQEITRQDLLSGLLKFTPAQDGNGTAYTAFDFQVSDGSSFSDSAATLSIDVTAVNDNPVPADDMLTTDLDTDLTILPADLLTNDTDVDGPFPLTIQSVTSGTGGTATLQPDGTVLFSPNAGFDGDATFTYTVADGSGATETASVIVLVAEPDMNITGTSGNDVLEGGNGNDTIDGLGGDDTIRGFGGVDLLIGGDGQDYLYGGYGDDELRAGSGTYDRLYGEQGNDTLLGSSDDRSYLYGGEGADTLTGGAGTYHYIRGEEGSDTLNGGTGVYHFLYGGDGDDILTGGSGDQHHLDGDQGDDVLTSGSGVGGSLDGGAGDDTLIRGSTVTTGLALRGQDGNDTYVFGRNNGTGNTIHPDNSDGGLDTVSFGEDVTHDQLWFQQSSDQLFVYVIGGSTRITIDDWFDSVPSGQPENYNQVEWFQTSDGYVLNRTQVQAMVEAMDGQTMPSSTADPLPQTVADAIVANWRQDAVPNASPKALDSTVLAVENSSYVLGLSDFGFSDPDAADTVQLIRIDRLPYKGTFTLNGIDVVVGQEISPADIATGDLVFTPAPDEADPSNYTNFDFSVSDGIYWSIDHATLRIDVEVVNEAPVAIGLSDVSVAENFEGGPVGDLTVVDPDSTSFPEGRHTFTLSDSRFEVHDAELKLKEGVSLDFETEPTINLTVIATDGGGLSVEHTYTLSVEDIDDALPLRQYLIGSNSGETITGGIGDDIVDGVQGRDYLYGGDGNDELRAGSGSYTEVYGEAGDDILVGGNGSRQELYGGTGDDTITASGSYSYLYGEDGNDTLNVGNSGRGYVYGGDGNDNLTSGYGWDDILYGDAGDDTLVGGGGWGHRLEGGLGNDILIAGSGREHDLYGGDGNDVLTGGSGREHKLYGGEGNDTLTGGSDSNHRLYGDAGDDVLTSGTGRDQYLYGGTGADTLISGKSETETQRFYGQDGADTYVFGRNNGGANTIYTLNTDGAQDTLTFGDDVTHEQLWFQNSSGNLVVRVVGGSTALAIDDWFSSPPSGQPDNYDQVEWITTSDGYVLNRAQVQAMVDAMAGQTIPGSVDDPLPQVVADAVAANWVPEANFAPTDITTTILAVDENAANGTSVGSVQSVVDSNAGDTHTFSLADDAGGRFAINATTGAITVADGSLLDYETATSHQITVRATDSGGLSYDEVFAVSIGDVVDTDLAPTDLALSGATVAENSANDTVVGTASTTDPNTGDSHTYSLTNDAGGRFAINATSGEVTVADGSLLDYETATSHQITVRSTDQGGLTYDEAFNITLTDVAEAPTDISTTALAVDENASNGTSVGSVQSVTDPDVGDSHTYSLTDDAGGRFAINATTGEVTVANGSLLDYETATSHQITVRSTDQGGLTYDEAFNITLTDVAEAPTDITTTALAVDENASNGTSVGSVQSVTDPDVGDSHTYSLMNDAGGRFAINTTTGAITVADGSLLDYETATSHQVTIRTTDSGGLTYDEVATVAVNDIAEPTNLAPTDMTLSGNSATEGAANGSVVGTVSTTDPDAGDTHTYSLTNDAGGRFAINATTGQVTVANGSLLDYETATSHQITVRSTDQGGLTYDEAFNITLTDVAEAPTDISTTALAVDENASNGTSVGSVQSVTDPDVGDSHTYSLTDDAGGRFAINATTGAITVADGSLLDYETATSHQITIQTTDAGGLTYSEVATVAINDVAEGGATEYGISFDGSGDRLQDTSFSGFPTDTLTIEVDFKSTATGADVEFNTLLSYVSGSEPQFQVFSRDTNGSLGVKVHNAQEGIGNAPFDGTRHRLTITYEVSTGAVEYFVDGVSVGTDTASTKAGISFDALGDLYIGAHRLGETGSYQGVSYFEGEIYDVKIWDRVLTPAEVSSGDSTVGLVTHYDFPEGSGNTTADEVGSNNLTLIQDAAWVAIGGSGNEAPTNITISGNTVNENASAGSIVGDLAALDPDQSDTHSFTLLDNLARFEINGQDQLVVAPGAGLDYEQEVSFNVTVRTTDAGGLSYDKIFNININDINEAPTDITTTALAVDENASNGTSVGSVQSVTDPDVGDSHTYSLMNDAGGRFAINTTTGAITVADGSLLDYETATSHQVTIRTTDSGGLTYDEVATVAVNDIAEPTNLAPTDMTLSGNSATEGAANGSVVGTVSTTDPDAGDTHTYSLTNDAGGRFAINATTGEVTVANGSLLDYETATSHQITVRSTDQGGLTYDEAFNVQVNNVATTFAIANASVSEGGTLSFTVTRAGDTDGTNALNYATASNTAISGVDFTAKSGSLTFTAGQISKTITVSTIEDSTYESTESLKVNLSNATNGATFADSLAYGSIINDDPAPPAYTAITNSSGYVLGSASSDYYRQNVTVTGPLGPITIGYRIKKSSNDQTVYESYPNTFTATGYRVVSGVLEVQSALFGDPLVFDLDGDGLELIAPNTSSIVFDMDGDGIAQPTGWFGADDGILVLDRNQDGVINDIHEISFLEDAPGAQTDLEALLAFDSNGDLVFDAVDERFAEFQIWQDIDQDGVTDPGELMTLADAGIVSIDLDRQPTGDEMSPFGDDNVLLSTSSFARADGTSGQVGDVAFKFFDEGSPGPASTAGPDQTTLEVPSPFHGFQIASLTGLNGLFGAINIPDLSAIIERVQDALADIPSIDRPDVTSIFDQLDDQSGLVQDRLSHIYDKALGVRDRVEAIKSMADAPSTVQHNYADVDKLVQAMASFAPNVGISTGFEGTNSDLHGDVVATAIEQARQHAFT
ncbi:MAG: cadherin domain-containing protein [Alphaproteobacteria bacterium]